ncbi:MAG: hypothetical protein NTW87_37105 [Planctomycetota bacterium]|nr:hypothetical protein [Planctomycetota bacterium]
MKNTVLLTVSGFVVGGMCLVNSGCGAPAQKHPIMDVVRVVYEVGHPGVILGIITRPGQAPECMYVLLLKAPAAGVAHTQRTDGGETSFNDRDVEVTQPMMLDGCRIEIHYKLDFGTGTESLSLNDTSIDLKKGRVFLVERTTASPVYSQKDASLSVLGAPKLDDEYAYNAATELSKNDAEIKQFLEGK